MHFLDSMFRSVIFASIVLGSIVTAQTKVETLGLEASSTFSLHRLRAKSHFSAGVSQQFFTKDDGYFSGTGADGSTSSPLIYNQLRLAAFHRFNKVWYGKIALQRQLGRYFFYNRNRVFSTAGAALGHRGHIDEIRFYKEAGAYINDQKPRSLKDLYILAKFEYVIKNKGRNIALASLAGKIDWLGTSFKSDKNDIFVLRGKDESFIKKVDQSWLILNFDFFLSERNVLSANASYFVEYYPTADVGFDKRNVKHYIVGLGWRYYMHHLEDVTDPIY